MRHRKQHERRQLARCALQPGVYGGLGAGQVRLAMSLLASKNQLANTWYGERHRARPLERLTRVHDLTRQDARDEGCANVGSCSVLP